VQTNFCHDQRQVVRNGVQVFEIGRELCFLLEIDVEGGKIEKWQLKICGGGKIYVGCESVRIDRFGDVEELLQEGLHFFAAVPANNGRRNLVPDSEPKNASMPGTRFDLSFNS